MMAVRDYMSVGGICILSLTLQKEVGDSGTTGIISNS